MSRSSIKEVMSDDCKCCEHGRCLATWKEKLGKKVAKAIIVTERHVNGALRDTQTRREHYVNVLRQFKHEELRTPATGGPKVVTRK